MQTIKNVSNVLLTIAFVMVVAAILAAGGFVVLVFAMYYTIALAINHGLVAGALAIIAIIALLIISIVGLIKVIKKGE